MHLSATIVTAFWPFQVPTYLYVFCVDAFTDKFFAKIYFGPTSFWESGLLEWSIYLYWFSLPQAYNYLVVYSNVQYLLLLYSGTCGCVGVVLHYWRCSSSIGKNSNTFFDCLCLCGYSARSIKCCVLANFKATKRLCDFAIISSIKHHNFNGDCRPRIKIFVPYKLIYATWWPLVSRINL